MNIEIILFDDLKVDSQKVLKRLCSFLDVDYVDYELEKSNVSIKSKNIDINIDSIVMKELVELYKQDLILTEKLCEVDLMHLLNKY